MDLTLFLSFQDTRAASGTADTPALPIKGLILFSGFLINKFIILTQGHHKK